MLIDWFTVAAQVVNFLVLVWLMQRFLYKPILSAIDARESGIAAKLADAEAKEAEARTERDEFRHKTETFEQQRADLLRKATDEAGAEHGRLLAAARTDADAARSGWQDALRNEQHGLGEEIVRRTQQGVFDIARKTLADLATVGLEECMTGVFIARLRGLSGPEHDAFAVSLKASPQPALVRSAFDLPPAQRAAIQEAVSETLTVQTRIRFEAAPSLVSGIELTMDGQKVAWSVSDFLETLERNVGELVEEKATPDANPAGAAEPMGAVDAKAAPVQDAETAPAAQAVGR
jgi:F-type H+-transporting ATPase subunit b